MYSVNFFLVKEGLAAWNCNKMGSSIFNFRQFGEKHVHFSYYGIFLVLWLLWEDTFFLNDAKIVSKDPVLEAIESSHMILNKINWAAPWNHTYLSGTI